VCLVWKYWFLQAVPVFIPSLADRLQHRSKTVGWVAYRRVSCTMSGILSFSFSFYATLLLEMQYAKPT